MGIDPPNPAIEVDLSASATPSAAPAVELNSPCFSATPKEDPGICKKPWLKAITTKRGDELFGKFKTLPI